MDQSILQSDRPPKPSRNISTIRLKPTTAKQMHRLLSLINKKELGRHVKGDDLILLALSLIKDEHIETLKTASLSNADHIELKFREHIKTHGKLSRDEFLGLILHEKNIQDKTDERIPNDP